MGRALGTASDDALVSAIGDQNQDALAEIYRRHGGSVWAVASRVCSSTSLAEQVCEGIFTELWSRPGRFDPSLGSLRSWLVAQAHGRAVDAARSEQATRPEPDIPRDQTPRSAEVEGAERSATLTGPARQLVDQLATAERDALLLTYLGGRSCSETARLLGASEDTVKDHIRRGLTNLRKALDAREVTQ